MKKLLILLTLFSLSCSTSDDSNQPIDAVDLFVGKWNFGNTVFKLNSGLDYTDNISGCEAQTFYRFNSDNSVDLVSFLENNGSCEQENNNISSFTWQKLSDTSYKLSSIEIDGTQSSSTETVVFVNDNTMYWVDVINGTTEEGDTFNERWSYFNSN